MNRRFRSWILLIGDLLVMYAALALALYARGGVDLFSDFWEIYFVPFSILNILWLLIFYSQDLYSRHHFRLSGVFLQSFVRAMVINGVLVVLFFYIVPEFGISPKTNLLVYILIFAVLFLFWRTAAGRVLTGSQSKKPVIFLEPDHDVVMMINDLVINPMSLYRVVGIIHTDEPDIVAHESIPVYRNRDIIDEVLERGEIDTIIVGNKAFHELRTHLYEYKLRGVSVIDVASFWEDYRQQIPVSVTDAAWFMTQFSTEGKREVDLGKRLIDVVGSLVLMILSSWLFLLIAVVIKVSSRGSIFYIQTRTGKQKRLFKLYKFRTMITDAEVAGPQWASKKDPRVTPIGSFLRHTHLDELPQLWNILKGDMSFVGPRPERPEFVSMLEAEIPFYALRHLIKPGVTGWAQVKYRYGASVKDAENKLTYDLYYIKHRALIFDAKIVLKTLATLFRGEGR